MEHDPLIGLRDPESVTHVRGAPACDVAQGDDLTQPRRQASNGCLDVLVELSCEQVPLGVCAVHPQCAVPLPRCRSLRIDDPVGGVEWRSVARERLQVTERTQPRIASAPDRAMLRNM